MGIPPLTEDSKTLTFVPQIGCFVVPKFGSHGMARKFIFFFIFKNLYLFDYADLRNQSNTASKKGSMSTKCDHTLKYFRNN